MAKYSVGEKVMYIGDDFGGCVEVEVMMHDGSPYYPYKVYDSSEERITWADESELAPIGSVTEDVFRKEVLAELRSLREEVQALKAAQMDEEPTANVDEPSTPLILTERLTKRKHAIDFAKHYVSNTLSVVGRHHEHRLDANHIYNGWISHVDFVVNEDKRTVVAIARKKFNRSEVVGRGIAKCHPNDVFNADIGKAVALIKLFGLPSERKLFNAPNPDKFCEGMLVGPVNEDEEQYWGPYTIDHITDDDELYDDDGTYVRERQALILSDTGVNYGE